MSSFFYTVCPYLIYIHLWYSINTIIMIEWVLTCSAAILSSKIRTTLHWILKSLPNFRPLIVAPPPPTFLPRRHCLPLYLFPTRSGPSSFLISFCLTFSEFDIRLLWCSPFPFSLTFDREAWLFRSFFSSSPSLRPRLYSRLLCRNYGPNFRVEVKSTPLDDLKTLEVKGTCQTPLLLST